MVWECVCRKLERTEKSCTNQLSGESDDIFCFGMLVHTNPKCHNTIKIQTHLSKPEMLGQISA